MRLVLETHRCSLHCRLLLTFERVIRTLESCDLFGLRRSGRNVCSGCSCRCGHDLADIRCGNWPRHCTIQDRLAVLLLYIRCATTAGIESSVDVGVGVTSPAQVGSDKALGLEVKETL